MSELGTYMTLLNHDQDFAAALVELLVSADISIVHSVSIQAGEMMLSEH